MSAKKGISRRKFLIRSSIGVGVLLGAGVVGCGPIRRMAATQIDEVDIQYNIDEAPNVWFEVTADNRIILHSPKVEMGQGIFTSLAQMSADELDVKLEDIEVVNASTSSGPIDPVATGGSNTVSSLWQPLRELAATMREMIKTEAAKLMQVDQKQLTTKDGMVLGNGKSMTYGEVVAQVKEWDVPQEAPALKDRSAYKYIGQPIPRIDLEAKVKGDPIFGYDVTMPDMLYGAVVRPSMVDARFESAEIEEALKVPDVVKVVLEDDFVGVVAKTRMGAEKGKAALKVNWKIEKVWHQEDIEKMIKVGEGNAVQIQKEGSPRSKLNDDNVIQAEYTSPIGAHAHLEPNGTVAFVEGDKAIIRVSTQVVDYTRKEVAKRLGLKKENVDVQSTYLGGAFGRRLHTPNAIQAAVMSKAVGKPVHSFFTRKEEFQNDMFRPPTHHVLKAKLKADGLIDAIEHNVSSGDVAFGSTLLPDIAIPFLGADFGAWRGGLIQYTAIPNYSAFSWRVKLPFATSWWRSLGLLANSFAIESFMDELAIKAGKDPVQFRLDQIADDERGKRLKGVIKAAADKAGWGKDLPEGRAVGFACSTDANTPVAQVVEVSIKNDEIKVHKVTCAIDPGIAVNPDGIRAQCEGAIIMGLSASLFEKMVIKDGAIVPTNYGIYQMALMRHAPKDIDVVILENADKPSGVGEPPLGPVGAAIANAVFRLTGKRLRDLPLSLA